MLVHIVDMHHTCTGFKGRVVGWRWRKERWENVKTGFWEMGNFGWTQNNVLMFFDKLLCIYVERFYFHYHSLIPFAFCMFCVRFIKYWITPCPVWVCERESEWGAAGWVRRPPMSLWRWGSRLGVRVRDLTGCRSPPPQSPTHIFITGNIWSSVNLIREDTYLSVRCAPPPPTSTPFYTSQPPSF